MPQFLCKSADNIYWLRFIKPGQTPFTVSKFDLKDKKVIDTSWLNVSYYKGWNTNEHHITTKCYYKMVIPFISLYIKNFPFNIDDFTLKEFITKENFDVSYLIPKDNTLRFTIERNGVLLSEHGDFSTLNNMEKLWEKPGFVWVKTYYHYLFRGSHSCNRIINETIDNDKKILITGDSMSIPIIPIIACYYKEVVYMDNRDGLSHKDYYENKTFDDVIIQLWEGDTMQKPLVTNLK